MSSLRRPCLGKGSFSPGTHEFEVAGASSVTARKAHFARAVLAEIFCTHEFYACEDRRPVNRKSADHPEDYHGHCLHCRQPTRQNPRLQHLTRSRACDTDKAAWAKRHGGER